MSMMAHYDAKDLEALVRLVASGVVSIFPAEVLEGIHAASQKRYAALIASNEAFCDNLHVAEGIQG